MPILPQMCNLGRLVKNREKVLSDRDYIEIIGAPCYMAEYMHNALVGSLLVYAENGFRQILIICPYRLKCAIWVDW